MILRLVSFLFVGRIPNLRRLHLCILHERAKQGPLLKWHIGGAITYYASHFLAQIGNEDESTGCHLHPIIVQITIFGKLSLLHGRSTV